jgi:Heparinase II/III-like protein/Heparinase II/III N-terminus
MSIIRKIKRALRGEVNARDLAREAVRRSRVARGQRRERASLERLAQSPARLRAEFASLSPSELLEHFRDRTSPKFLPGFDSMEQAANLQRHLFPSETAELIESASRIADEHCWPLLGYGEKHFGEKIELLRDPLSNQLWPLRYHADVKLFRGDGSDARVLWEVNRLAHLVTLARAFAVTGDEKFAHSAFAQAISWREQNPLGHGANWACAMEVALRAMNLLAVFDILRRSAQISAELLNSFLEMFDQHGAHIRRNLEFSYISTSNHYLSDVVGLFWIGVMLPELKDAGEWRAFALREILREMDKQVLTDGADFEASTAYHRLVLELFLYTFILARANDVEIDERYWKKLRLMIEYVRAYLRPDGRAPLIGDTDSGQILPLRKRAGDDHAYVLALGAVLFDEPRFKQEVKEMPEELLWILGEDGVKRYESLPLIAESVGSQGFADAGTYIMREDDLYLLFNASGSGLSGRGSHGHNDALSIEVSACGTSFIVDPGTYVYSADLEARHLFRSTAYHSTVEVDGVEQNSTDVTLPFVIGNEAEPRTLRWETSAENDLVIAEHEGYRRLAQPVTHRREARFDKRNRLWIIEDGLTGAGEHHFSFRFHFADDLEIKVRADSTVQACDKMTGARLFVLSLDAGDAPELEPRFISRDYGAKSASLIACWKTRARLPFARRWCLVPVCASDDEEQRLSLAAKLRNYEF